MDAYRYADTLNISKADDILRSLLDPDVPMSDKSVYLSSLGASSIEDLIHKEDLVVYHLRIKLMLTVAPILLIMGVLGNILSFAVLMRPSMRRVSTYRYLAALSLADTAMLLLGLLPLWIETLDEQKNPVDMSNWTCKLLSFLLYSTSTYSTWLIIAMTTERYIAVCHPFKAASACTTSKAVKVIVILLLLIMAMNVHMFFTLELQESHHICSAAAGYHTLIMTVLPWLDALMYSFIPSIVISILNCCIIKSAVKARRKRMEMLRDDVTRTTPTGSRKFRGQSRGQSEKRMRSYAGSDSGSRLTIMLLSISITFLMTTLPINILYIVKPKQDQPVEQGANYKLAIAMTRLLMYVNHSANLLLYCTTGQKFRQQFYMMISMKRKKCNIDSVGTTLRSVVGFRYNTKEDSDEMTTFKANRNVNV